jgi:uncharacterized protein YfaA (DUF2138 family)
MWRGAVPSTYGEPGEKSGGQGEQRFLLPGAAVWQFTAGGGEVSDVILFSPNAALVQTALDVAAKKFPAIADSFDMTDMGDEQMIAWVNPAILAKIFGKEITDAAPSYDRDDFLAVTDFLFTPRLKALARYAPQAVTFPLGKSGKGLFGGAAGDQQWYPLTWREKADGAGSPGDTKNTSEEKGAANEAIEP